MSLSRLLWGYSMLNSAAALDHGYHWNRLSTGNMVRPPTVTAPNSKSGRRKNPATMKTSALYAFSWLMDCTAGGKKPLLPADQLRCSLFAPGPFSILASPIECGKSRYRHHISQVLIAASYLSGKFNLVRPRRLSSKWIGISMIL